jgi:hypothetical protein
MLYWYLFFVISINAPAGSTAPFPTLMGVYETEDSCRSAAINAKIDLALPDYSLHWTCINSYKIH